MTALTHINPTSAGIFRDNYCAQGHRKRDTLYNAEYQGVYEWCIKRDFGKKF
jgi:hypothetical protein